MLMGDVCTRNCPYCAVAHGRVRPLDPDEPRRIAEAVARLGLQHVVVTSVDRDDLRDGGAAHFAATARAIKADAAGGAGRSAGARFQGRASRASRPWSRRRSTSTTTISKRCRASIANAVPAAVTNSRSTCCAMRRRPRANPVAALLTKAGVMLGLGEERDELLAVMRDLRAVDCDILTLGQYLRPRQDHLPVARYVPPANSSNSRRSAWRWASVTSNRVRWCAAPITPGNT